MSFFSPTGKEKGILSRLCPATPLFSRQSACPFHSGCTRRVMLLLLVNVWSLFVTVAVCVCSVMVTSGEKSHWMVGAGLPVAEQLNTTSTSLGACTSVFTSDIPSQRKKTGHFEGWSHSDKDNLITWTLWSINVTTLRLYYDFSTSEFMYESAAIYLAPWGKSAFFWTHQDTRWKSKCNSFHHPT